MNEALLKTLCVGSYLPTPGLQIFVQITPDAQINPKFPWLNERRDHILLVCNVFVQVILLCGKLFSNVVIWGPKHLAC